MVSKGRCQKHPDYYCGGSVDDYTEGKIEGILLVQKNWHCAHEFFKLFFTKHHYYLKWDILAKTTTWGHWRVPGGCLRENPRDIPLL